MEERKPVIRVKDLYKVYKVGDTKVRALNGVSFDIYRGEFCAIVGASGSGKSTLLNMLAGLEKPTKGEIVIATYERLFDGCQKVVTAYIRDDNEWKIEFGGVCNASDIKAWMPLPEPYKPKGE